MFGPTSQDPLEASGSLPVRMLVPPLTIRRTKGESLMAKGQMRPQKEVKKPKKDKADKAAKAPASFEKGVSSSGSGGKRKD